jgi:GWxTD domain-containing protein
MLLKLRLVLLALLFTFCAHAIEAVSSYTVFYKPDEKKDFNPYIEVYWQIDPNSLHFIKDHNKWVSKIITYVTIRNADGAIVKEDKYVLQTKPADSLDILNQSIIELQRYQLPTGKYKLGISLQEQLVPENSYTYSDSFAIEPAIDKPFYSGIELADTAYNSGKENTFSKNNITLIPYCNNFYNDNKVFLHCYTELYNSEHEEKNTYPLVQTITISKKPFENAINKLRITDTIKTATVVQVLRHFNITTLPSGNYYLNFKLENKNAEVVTTASLFFQRSNLHPATLEIDPKDTGLVPVELIDLEHAFVSKYNVPQLKAIIKMLLPIATPLEKATIENFLKKPDATYMRYFVYNFWKNRNDKDPSREWDKYTDRVREVNKLFGEGIAPAYESDRGYIYLKYGKPDERIIALNESGSLPYELWQYNAPGKESRQGIFLFYQPGNMLNDFRLLHSTVKGEVRNTNWRDVLYIKAGGNPQSRAEQYLGN